MKNIKKAKNIKQGSESSSERSNNNSDENESNSLIFQKKKKIKKVVSHYTETSPNMRFSRLEEKRYYDKYLVSYLAMDHDRGCNVIWNVVNVTNLEEDKKGKLFSSLMNLKDLKHENINTISEVWIKDKNNIIFITDSFFGGSIRQYLHKIGIQKLKVIKSWIKMILQGLDYLHKNKLFYRNLNCGRIYYNSNNGVVSIGDLFLASPEFNNSFKVNINETQLETFSLKTISSELTKSNQITESFDIFLLGLVLIEMITIDLPYGDNSIDTQRIKDCVKPIVVDRINDEAVKKFINILLEPDPNKRPSIEELLKDDFLKIDVKNDNRKIKLIKIRNKKRKKDKDKDADDSMKRKKEVNKKSGLLFKRDFKEDVPIESENLFITDEKKEGIRDEFNKEDRKKIINTESANNVINQIVTSSQDCCTISRISKYHSDVNHTANTDYFNPPTSYDVNKKNTLENNNLFKINIEEKNKIQKNTENNSNYNNYQTLESNIIDHVNLKNPSKFKAENIKKQNSNSEQISHNSNYQIFDSNYNVQVKFLINQDNKLHEIRFTYNLIRDNIPDLMEEIQNEFNFSHENLNHIYETLKKISIYSKFYKKSDILHDNSA